MLDALSPEYLVNFPGKKNIPQCLWEIFRLMEFRSLEIEFVGQIFIMLLQEKPSHSFLPLLPRKKETTHRTDAIFLKICFLPAEREEEEQEN